MSYRGLHVCRFDVGLTDLTRKEQADDEVVLHVLRLHKRFSSFEASDNPVIAKTITRLCKARLTTDHSVPYPWVKITAIDGEPLEEKASD